MASTMFGMTGQQNNGFDIQKFQNDLNNLKATGMNPEQMIQNLMNQGKVTQQQYEAACQKARMIQQMMGHQNGS